MAKQNRKKKEKKINFLARLSAAHHRDLMMKFHSLLSACLSLLFSSC